MSEIVATYRVQLNKDFTFYDLIEVIPYLHQLGISHLYLSPVFESVKGSEHGYDIVDPLRISAERGGEDGLFKLDGILSALRPPMKMIFDIVPNHMSAYPENPYWYDVLEKGIGSAYWRFFDLKVRPGHKIMLPCLKKELIKIIRSGDAAIEARDGKIEFQLFDKYYPLKEASRADLPDVRSLSPEDTAEIMRQQNYELVHWLKGLENLSYRRFFDVIDLIGIRMEDENVFQHMHQKLFELKSSLKSLDGVRVDHIDGLADPAGYLKKLAGSFEKIWVEKILAREEVLHEDWPVMGTTGYEFVDRINQLFVDFEGFNSIEQFWRLTIENNWENFDACLNQSRETVLTEFFLPEFQRVTGLLATDDRTWFFWKALTLMLSVYRTYVFNGISSPGDIDWVEKALKKAGLFQGWENRVAKLLLRPRTPEQIKGLQEWQQLTGPIMAKGLEDTAHYRYAPLAALNEVGCLPLLSTPDLNRFQRWCVARHKDYPAALNATSTHDTKRAEDARHRLYALSTMPEQWITFVEHARQLNESSHAAGIPRRVKYFFYQAVVSTWPGIKKIDESYIERIGQYMTKATKEMKLETSWLRPKEEFDLKILQWVRQSLSDMDFIAYVEKFAVTPGTQGAMLSLSVLTLKCLSGGVPDIYQGTELWSFSLVDPDNRRSIDYAMRKKILDGLVVREQGNRLKFLKELCDDWADGAIKLWLTKALLDIRRSIVEINATEFVLLPVSGQRKSQLMSFSLSAPDEKICWIITVPILLKGLEILPSLSFTAGYWADTAVSLPENMTVYDCLSQEYMETDNLALAASLFTNFPVSILKCSAKKS